MTKRCFKCLRELPVDEFYRHSQMADGRLSKCKDCAKADVREARRKRIEAFRQYDRDRAGQPQRVKVYQKVQERERAEFPERQAARLRAKRAHGVRPETCDGCNTPGLKLERHHPDYSKPTVILWLCKPCHVIADRVRRVVDAANGAYDDDQKAS